VLLTRISPDGALEARRAAVLTESPSAVKSKASPSPTAAHVGDAGMYACPNRDPGLSIAVAFL
jgi:hypothetical protein